MTSVRLWDEPETVDRWHLGWLITSGGTRRSRWMNQWLTNPCTDLAFPFEVGVRAAHGTNNE